MNSKLDQKLATFLKQQRGQTSYKDFSKKIGLNSSSIHRIEQGEQSITLRSLEMILKRLKLSVLDVFRD
jgi:transcriptional regulator with XRE-family HTH domain